MQFSSLSGENVSNINVELKPDLSNDDKLNPVYSKRYEYKGYHIFILKVKLIQSNFNGDFETKSLELKINGHKVKLPFNIKFKYISDNPDIQSVDYFKMNYSNSKIITYVENRDTIITNSDFKITKIYPSFDIDIDSLQIGFGEIGDWNNNETDLSRFYHYDNINLNVEDEKKVIIITNYINKKGNIRIWLIQTVFN